MTALPLLYPFTADDLRERPGATTDAYEAVIGLWVSEAAKDHADGRHHGQRHPWCFECEYQHGYNDVDLRPDIDAELAYGDDVEATVLNRARRWKILNGRPPAPPSSTTTVTFDAGTLREVLDRDPDPPMRIEGLIPANGSTLIPAKRKTGKTTIVLNLARCLITGDDFLGTFPVRKIEGRVGVLNYEVSGPQLARWADESGVDVERLFLVNLRGVPNPLRSQTTRAALAGLLRSHDVESLIVDTFGRAYTGNSQNDAGEVTAFLTELDVFARSEVGAADLILTTHAGWDGERTRGSTALEDWPDSIITLTANDAGDRFLKALGRDVDVEEDRLTFEPRTRALTMAGTGSRKKAAHAEKVGDLVEVVVDVVTATPGLSGYKVEQQLRKDGVPFQRGDESKALALAVERGLLTYDEGPRNAKLYRPPPTPTYPTPTPTGYVPTYPDLPIEVGVGGGGQQHLNGSGVGQGTDHTQHRLCPECDEPLPPGKVRHGPCHLRLIQAERVARKETAS